MLAGSSGRIDTARVDMLTARGVTALGLRWFGGQGLPPVPAQVPLEFFIDALDALADECDRLVVSPTRRYATAAARPGRSERAPEAMSVKTRSQPAVLSSRV